MRGTSGFSEEAGSLARSETEREAQALEELEERIGYRFRRRDLLEQALTHRSWTHEHGEAGVGNERLEFLGDAVLDLLVSELLMEVDESADEGALSRGRADAVNTRALARQARTIGLDEFARLGRGEERSGGRHKPSILANVFEAVVAAVYLDGGYRSARELVRRLFGGLATEELRPLGDPKTRLQERLQAGGQPLPRYETTGQQGPDHAREFEVRVLVGERVLGSGVGRSKRAAEQAAALEALEKLDP
jgi:ribonuclease-3